MSGVDRELKGGNFAELWGSVEALRRAVAAGYINPGRDELSTLALAAEIDRPRKDGARLAFLVLNDCVAEGFVGLESDRHEYAMQVAEAAGRDEPTEADCVDGFRLMVDAFMAKVASDEKL